MPSPFKKSFAAEQLKRQQQEKKTGLWIFLAVVGVVVVVGGFALYSRFGAKEESAPEKEKIKSIAVLPFEDLSPDKDQEWFCNGISESILNALTNVKDLRVIARTSSFEFKGKENIISEIGEKLNVEAILEGSVLKSGNRLLITSQLVNVADESHIFSNQYDCEVEDVFAILKEISLAVVDEVKGELLTNEKASIEKRPTEDQEAYELYLLGKHFMNKRGKGFEKGLEYFQQAVEKDPGFALAYAGLAESYDWLGYEGIITPEEAWSKAREMAEKALKIDDTLAEAHTVLADVSFLYDRDWDAAERGFKKAIALNPGYSTAHLFYSYYLSIMGRLDEELVEKKQALEIDPLSVGLYSSLSYYYCKMGSYEEAMEQIHKMTEIDPNHVVLYWSLGYLHSFQGNYKESINAFQKSIKLGGKYDHLLGYLYALSGERDKAAQILHALIEKKKTNYYSSAKIAMVYAGLDETDKAFEWLEKANDEHDSVLINFINAPYFDHLHSDPRFKALLKKMGLPE